MFSINWSFDIILPPFGFLPLRLSFDAAVEGDERTCVMTGAMEGAIGTGVGSDDVIYEMNERQFYSVLFFFAFISFIPYICIYKITPSRLLPLVDCMGSFFKSNI